MFTSGEDMFYLVNAYEATPGLRMMSKKDSYKTFTTWALGLDPEYNLYILDKITDNKMFCQGSRQKKTGGTPVGS